MDFAPRPTSVRAVRVAPLDMALRAPFGISRGSLGTAANVLVAVELSDGTVGHGRRRRFRPTTVRRSPRRSGAWRTRSSGCRGAMRRTGGASQPNSAPPRGGVRLGALRSRNGAP